MLTSFSKASQAWLEAYQAWLKAYQAWLETPEAPKAIEAEHNA